MAQISQDNSLNFIIRGAKLGNDLSLAASEYQSNDLGVKVRDDLGFKKDNIRTSK